MSDLSFVSLQPIITADGVTAEWSSIPGKYLVKLGRGADDAGGVQLFLAAPVARTMAAALIAAMVERGDVIDFQAVATEAIAALQTLAHDASWGRGDSIERLSATLGHLGYVAADPAARDAADDAACSAAATAEQRQWAAVGRGARAVR